MAATVLDEYVPVSAPVRELVAFIGTLAQQRGPEGAEAAQIALDLAVSFDPKTTLSIRVQAIHILCELLEPLRAQQDVKAVAKVEKLVQSLKGGRPRLIRAEFNTTVQNVHEADDAYERLRKRIVQAR